MIAHEAREEVDDILLELVDNALTAALVETLLYGIHLILFCICAYFLVRKRRGRAGIIILLSVVIMLALATADVAVTFRLIVIDLHAILRLEFGLNDLLGRIRLKNNLFVTDNMITDGLLLYRCYIVWKGHKFDNIIAFVASVLLVADTIWGYLATETHVLDLQQVIIPVYLWSVFAFNVVMTAATAGRIWWMARISRTILGKQSIQSYNIAIAILIESGAIYALSIMLLLIFWGRPYKMILFTTVYRLVGIIPTLMIVQVELGGRGQKASSDSLKMTTHPVFTTIAVDNNSTQVHAEGPLPGTEDHCQVPSIHDTQAIPPLPTRSRDEPDVSEV